MNDDELSNEEIERRASDAIRRSFQMPHKPQKALVGKVGRPPVLKPSKPIKKREQTP